jgi:drug/metabolite transporter (DMT)-like permease
MSYLALLLILLSAFLHALYNFLIKSSRDTIAFFWWSVALGAIGYGCWLLTGPGIFLSRASVPFFLASAAAEFGYFMTLVKGYERGDLSLVYPISRGSPPVFLAAWSAIFLAERLPFAGYAGIGVAVAGIYITSFIPNSAGKIRLRDVFQSFRDPATLWALASGIFISIYSLTDKLALSATPPLVYNFWVYAGNAVLWSAVVWRPGRARLNMAVVRTQPTRVLVAAFATVGAYTAVLIALTMTSASYVVAGRGLSVVIGALFGMFALNEGFGRLRLAGAVMTVAGLALMALS